MSKTWRVTEIQLSEQDIHEAIVSWAIHTKRIPDAKDVSVQIGTEIKTVGYGQSERDEAFARVSILLKESIADV